MAGGRDTKSSRASVAGGSTRAEGERRRAAEERRRRERVERHPILGRLANAAAGPPTAGASYLKGAVGEERLGAALDAMGHGILTLHDRRRPRTRANIDHLVIAPSGVWVVDAKWHDGLVTKVDKGGWFRSDIRLMVRGRDRMNLVEGVHRQVADVRSILDRCAVADVPVHGALCFIDAEFELFARPFDIDGVLVTWGKALRKHLAKPGSLDDGRRVALHRHLATALPPAS